MLLQATSQKKVIGIFSLLSDEVWRGISPMNLRLWYEVIALLKKVIISRLHNHESTNCKIKIIVYSNSTQESNLLAFNKVIRRESIVEVLPAVSAGGLASSVGSKRGLLNFPGRLASDMTVLTAERTFSAVELSSIRSGWWQLPTALKR